MLKALIDRIGSVAKSRPLSKAADRVNEKVRRTMHLKESYTCRILETVYGGTLYRANKKDSMLCKRAVKILLYIIVALAAFLPGYAAFTAIMGMYILFITDVGNKSEYREFSDFDILLVMFCFVILAVASVGKGLYDIISIWLVYSSFITLYFVTIHTADNKKTLFRLKFIFCIAGAVIAIIQIVQNVLSFEMMVLGQFYVLSVPMAFELFFQSKDKRLKAVLLLSSGVMLVALTMCWSGGSWVWATFILAFFIVIKDWRLLLAGGVGLLFVPFILPGEIIDFHKLAQNGIMDYLFSPSQDYRISAYGAITGLLNYYKDYSMTGKWYASVIIFICVLVLLVLLLREIFVTMKTGQLGMMCAILAAVGSGVTGFIYSDIMTGIWGHYKTLLIFWIYTSLYSAQTRLDNSKEKIMLPTKNSERFCFIDMIPILLGLAFLLAAL